LRVGQSNPSAAAVAWRSIGKPVPASAAAPLQIHSALLLQANLTASTIHNAASISTAALTVREQAEFLSNVVIDGSVTVHGTVVGSGPYVDSSDARLKRDVRSITGALDTVQQLRGVSAQ
jgi:hypothetical protein